MRLCHGIRQAFVSTVTKSIDFFFDVAGFDAHTNPVWFQFFLILVNLAFSVYPIVCLLIFYNDVHVLFWLGSAPFYVNISVPIAITSLNIGTTICKCTKPRPGTAKVLCFILFLLIGSVLMGAGAFMHYESSNVSEELIHDCGETPLTSTVETEWQDLWNFYQKCQAQTGYVEIITACPGYGTKFPDKDTAGAQNHLEHEYVDYLESVEIDFECVGFCNFLAKPLFNMDSDRELRCATAIGERIQSIGKLIAWPTMATGLFVCCLGACLAAYEHL